MMGLGCRFEEKRRNVRVKKNPVVVKVDRLLADWRGGILNSDDCMQKLSKLAEAGMSRSYGEFKYAQDALMHILLAEADRQ